jgi:diguanylate cyclase (GGDEF)-like protein
MPRVSAAKALESSNAEFFAALEQVPALFAICDADGRLQTQSNPFAQRFMQDIATLEAAFAKAIRSQSDGAKTGGAKTDRAKTGDAMTIAVAGAEFTLKPAPGATLWTVSLASAHEITSRDALTGLPDRAGLRQRMSEILADEQRRGRTALLLLDLDRFKSVNDTLGHPFGDKLLRKVVERIRHSLGEDAFVSRLGGDEFAILIEADDAHARADANAARLVDLIGRSYLIDGHVVTIGLSVGIALCSNADGNADRLLTLADLALYSAKESGRARHRFFEPGLEARANERRMIEQDLRRALALRQFEVYYQPQTASADNGVTGCEALIRWRHPERGMISPAVFIPIAEETGVIVQIGEWVLRTACEEAARWPSCVRLAVNLSPIQVLHPKIATVIAQALASSGLPANRLELEITEGVLMQDTDACLRTLNQIKSLGARVAMDDFGTGYSSLGYLRSFPFDKVKIDQTFVREMETSSDAAAIVRAVLSLGSSLGMSVTAEGVETQDQLDMLKAQGCAQIQGYLIGRPMPANDLQTFFNNNAATRKA